MRNRVLLEPMFTQEGTRACLASLQERELLTAGSWIPLKDTFQPVQSLGFRLLLLHRTGLGVGERSCTLKSTGCHLISPSRPEHPPWGCRSQELHTFVGQTVQLRPCSSPPRLSSRLKIQPKGIRLVFSCSQDCRNSHNVVDCLETPSSPPAVLPLHQALDQVHGPRESCPSCIDLSPQAAPWSGSTSCSCKETGLRTRKGNWKELLDPVPDTCRQQQAAVQGEPPLRLSAPCALPAPRSHFTAPIVTVTR